MIVKFFGTEAGLSPATIIRLAERWRKERKEEFMRHELSKRDYVYMLVDGIHTKVRLDQDAIGCAA